MMSLKDTAGHLESMIASIEQSPLEPYGHIYHPIPFPEFQHLKTSSRPRTARRKWKLLVHALSDVLVPGAQVVDIGANAGYFAYECERLGAHVDAIEPHDKYYELGRLIAEHHGLDITWFHQEIDESFFQDKHYDVALMLSVFQWISQGEKKLENATRILAAVAKHSENLAFELGCNRGGCAITAPGVGLRWVYSLLRKHTPYEYVVCAGMTFPWGPASPRFVFICSHSQRPATWSQTKRINFVVKASINMVGIARYWGIDPEEVVCILKSNSARRIPKRDCEVIILPSYADRPMAVAKVFYRAPEYESELRAIATLPVTGLHTSYVRVPRVLHIDEHSRTIVLEYLRGTPLLTYLRDKRRVSTEWIEWMHRLGR